HQLFSFDVEEEIAYGLENFGYSRELMENKVKKTLKEYHFESIKENEISTLSEGMKKRLAIASVMVLEPEILILDEPTANLDPKWSNKIITDIAKITRKNNTTTIIVEHELDLLLNKVDRVIVMKNGKIIKDTKDTRSEFAQKEQNAITTNLREFNKLLINSHPASLNYVIMVQKLWYHNILQDINMHISGGFVSIIGPNGAGKTTIIMHFNGLLKPTKGKVLVDGVDTRKSSVASLSRKVGIVFQNPELMFFEDSVEKELSFAPKNIGINAHDIEERVDKIAKQLNLEKLLDRNPFTLSSGEKQRVAIASVLTLEPDIIVLDEPTLGLCPKNKKKLLSIITNLKKEKTVVVVTHDLELVSRSDYIFVIN
ncbi:MAG TPA: ABC transporter ATP-binding protein, partial [Methanosarcinales archaeon]|nr:ABC transporter ATP-binding protein [Methanosarcinales archaeon]